MTAVQFNLADEVATIELGKKANIAVFVKQMGSTPIFGHRIDLKDSHGGNWDEWDAAFRVRQMPFSSS